MIRPVSILFVCHGNICRSPMAELMLRDMAAKKGMADRIYAESAATSDEELGNPVYPQAARELALHGISAKGKSARRITPADYGRFDMIILMDSSNVRTIRWTIPSDPQGKMSKLLDYSGYVPGDTLAPMSSRDISDPWYTGEFSRTYKDIMEGLEGLWTYIGHRYPQSGIR